MNYAVKTQFVRSVTLKKVIYNPDLSRMILQRQTTCHNPSQSATRQGCGFGKCTESCGRFRIFFDFYDFSLLLTLPQVTELLTYLYECDYRCL